ncbi:MAG: leucine-rich repeat domain-containing protein [Clostridia bacterium]|nr:leucine-rich repeat domain-containing protein [Clostridia bacterium]
MKRPVRLLLILLVCLLPFRVLAIDVDEEWSWRSQSYLSLSSVDVPEFSGSAPIPVTSAPYDEAWPGMDETLVCSSQQPFTILGTLQGLSRAMIAYTAAPGVERIGWIRIDPEATQEWNLRDLDINRVPCRVTRDIPATDSPQGDRRIVTVLKEGSTVIATLYLKGWLCVETQVDGLPAWLFTDPGALEEIPTVSIDGDTLRYSEGVTVIGGMSTFEDILDPESGSFRFLKRTFVHPGDIAATGFDLYDSAEECGVTIRHIELPDTLRMLGTEAFVFGSLDEFRIPASLESADIDTFYSTDIGRMLIPAAYTGDLPSGEYSTVGAYEVEEGNPRYSSRDGVLFSADGKTLISYPSGCKALHYDVPAGVEVIARYAFSNDLSDHLPLKSISLPIGLRRIEDYAFTGCGRLQSLTVPLTVTELGEKAFYYCVSLERLSLPPGLSPGETPVGPSEQADFTFYNGDNGSTADSAPDRKTGFSEFFARVDDPAGEGTVPVYSDAACTQAATEYPVGTEVLVKRISGGAFLIRDVDRPESAEFWIPADRLLQMTGGSLFHVSGFRQISTGRLLNEYDAEITGGQVRLLLDYAWDGDDIVYVTENCPREDFVLLRAGHDSRTLAMLCATADSPAIRFYDAPDGAETGHTYELDQAVVLERRDGWALVKTLRLQGWVREEHVWIALPEAEE